MAALASSGAATPPEGGFVSVWQGLYPASQSDDNLSSSCQLCHANSGGGNNYNAYGWRQYQILNAGGGIANAILQAEPFDSDEDPTGSSNLDEITWSTQPGWTSGNNNTVYFPSGATNPNQPPPAGISGSLDPLLGVPYCAPAVANSTGQPATITAIGSDVVSLNAVTLLAEQLPAGQFGYFLSSQTQGNFQPPGSQGFICLGGGIGRFNCGPCGQVGQGPSFDLQLDLNAIPTPTGFVGVLPGDVWNFQCWYRDLNPGITNNFTDAVSITFQ